MPVIIEEETMKVTAFELGLLDAARRVWFGCVQEGERRRKISRYSRKQYECHKPAALTLNLDHNEKFMRGRVYTTAEYLGAEWFV